ncbi:EEF1A lysine methyltransferase 2 isoform X2 [Phasianus colchicus]|uniref:EEF1A lysine methyltransferase 2 isoform X2 n=1 Tax=Phasianus colchicus TaxID=9054 RepID=UPI00129E68F0|nr:EEF1A lysine methyltransferase 2 isoform X2 [Phasianus colchicus]
MHPHQRQTVSVSTTATRYPGHSSISSCLAVPATMRILPEAKNGFTNLTGIDYSPSAIQLSEKVREKEGVSNIKLLVEDFLAPSAELLGFHICIDKGTFDAVSLNPDNAVGKRKQYVRSLCSVLKPEGFFLITSCNWTKEELLNEFREGFEIVEELPTPKFCFGGRIGNSVTALVFQRKK